MVRDFKTHQPMDSPAHSWPDLILRDTVGISEDEWQNIVSQMVAAIQDWPHEIPDRVDQLIDLLSLPLETLWKGVEGPAVLRWLPTPERQGATVADHSLMCSAIAYCLAYDDGYCGDPRVAARLRLSALTVAWQAHLPAVYEAIWSDAVDTNPIEPKANGEPLERMLYAASVLASERRSLVDGVWKASGKSHPQDLEGIRSRSDFTSHPLKADLPPSTSQIGLVMGGATKIKGYFLESARLPEIRGASALLDRINLEDVPALFGRKIEDKKRGERIRDTFWERTGHLLSAPECVIYAAGGSCLAFAPASLVHEVAEEIEHIYTRETLVANSVAVGQVFDLIELQYGTNPDEFWIEEFRQAKQTDAAAVLAAYYGGTEDRHFFDKKCFGELTAQLASAQLRRREGNHTPGRITQRNLPTFVETTPYVRLCTSCDRRPVAVSNPDADKYLCQACARKYVTGRATKKPSEEESIEKSYLPQMNGWEPAAKRGDGRYYLGNWISRFGSYIGRKDLDGPQDLSEIAEASQPTGFISMIYADGNNMGGYLERVSTPAQYRQFSERVFVTLQEAVYEALAQHLGPKDDAKCRFEVISIGGDDLLLIVPGDKAFEVACTIGTKFDGAFNSRSRFCDSNEGKLMKSQRYRPDEWLKKAGRQQPAISLSLGFVTAEAHTPISFLETLAEQLLKSAKKKAKALKSSTGYLGGTVDFLVLKSLSMISSNLQEYREELRQGDAQLTMRPFTLHEMAGFTETIRSLKEADFPRSQLYQLRKSIARGKATASVDYLYFRSRLKDRGPEMLQKALEEDWCGVGKGHALPPWYPVDDQDKIACETLLPDLIEAYEFVDEEPEGSTDASSESEVINAHE